MKKANLLVSAILVSSILLSACSGGTSAAKSEPAYPNKPITLYVAAGAGSAMDTCLRPLVPYLEKELGVSIGITNIAGGGGWTCYADVLNKEADGYSLTTLANSNFYGLYNPTVELNGSLDDWQLLANAITDPNALYTNKDSEVQTLEQFIDYVQNNKDILIGTSSIGFDDHTAYMKLASAIPGMLDNTTALPASDMTEVIANQLGGFQDFMVANVGDYNKVKDNMNVICIFDEQRSSLLPDVPTFNELAEQLGIDATVVNQTNRGYMMKAGADQAVVDRLVEAFEKAMANEEYQAELQKMYFQFNGVTGEDFNKLINDDLEAFKEVVKLYE
ncbi:MAG: tripartite tricarboxylate transporter substrate binding protein [Lachnospiraceae bacterium]|nr:tripartite tricarboxylate transporter substrate binding protein [Lachnospiraceae bacterium]